MNTFEELGREVAIAEERFLEAHESLRLSRQTFLDEIVDTRAARDLVSIGYRRRAVMYLSAAAAAVLVIAGWFWLGPGMDSGPSATKRIVVSETERVFNFSGGSRVVFLPKTLGEITTADEKNVAVLLKEGKATLSVVHRDDTDWRVSAGPYRVRVTGTRLEVDWQKDSKQFRVALLEGEVEVEGPMIPKAQTLQAGWVMLADLANERVELSRLEGGTDDGAGQATPLAAEPPADTAAPETPAPSREPFDVPSKRAVNRETACGAFRSLAKQGDFKGAYQKVKGLDAKTLFAACDAAGLLLLGDTARMEGDTALAKRAYRAVRKRYGKQEAAAIAALQLGRLAFDTDHRYDHAVHWLEIYLNEGAGTTLSREALGRLMEALERSGQPERARRTAATYLQSYPEGPHAGRARRLVAE